MVPDEIYVKALNAKTDVLEADITGRLYAWATSQE